MATQRLTMRNIREILRQKLVLHRTNRDIATSVGRSPATVSNIVVVVRARSYRNVKSILEKGLDRVPLPDLSDEPQPHQDEAHENIRGPRYYN